MKDTFFQIIFESPPAEVELSTELKCREVMKSNDLEKIVKAKGINKLLFLFHQFMIMKQVEKIMKASRPQNP